MPTLLLDPCHVFYALHRFANTLLSRIKAPDAPITSTFIPAELTIRDTTQAV